MNPLLSALVAAGIISPDDAERINRSMDPDAMRAWAEQRMAVAVQNGLSAQQQRVVDLVRRGNVTEAALADFWRAEDERLYAALRGTLEQVGGESAIGMAVRMGADDAMWRTVNEAVLSWVNGYYTSPDPAFVGSIPNLNVTAREQFAPLFEAWNRGTLDNGGRGLPQLVQALEPVFGPARAERIAVTEVTRVFTESIVAAGDANEAVTGYEWMTANDELVCFPAGTMVTVAGGDKPIERVAVGDMVMTRGGLRRVIATSRRAYTGRMTTIDWGVGSVTATANHPFWTLEQGWLQCGNLSAAHTLQSVANEPLKVVGVLNFTLGDTAHAPTAGFEKEGLSGVFRLVGMPVCSVDFQSDAKFGQHEIDAISPHLNLLTVSNLGCVEHLANLSLKHVFAPEPAVAGKAAKLPIGIARQSAEFFAAITALVNHWRTAAFLRAVMSVQSLFGDEYLSAPFAGSVLRFGQTTGAGANGVSVGYSRGNLERLSAGGTHLSDHSRRMSGIIAGSAAELALLEQLRAGQWFAAMFTMRRLCGPNLVVALHRAIDSIAIRRLEFLVTVGARLDRHVTSQSCGLRSLTTLYHKSLCTAIDVYDIQVEGEPEFYANGVLVHNCPICAPLNGRRVPKSARAFGTVSFPPAHVNCRCSVTEITLGMEEIERG